MAPDETRPCPGPADHMTLLRRFAVVQLLMLWQGGFLFYSGFVVPVGTDLLGRVGLAQRLTHRPGMLSGGEQQRVAVARALVMRPAVLLADEPTGDLDEQTGEALHGLLREMHRAYNLTSVIATHNPRLAAACDRVLRLESGRLKPA